MSMDWFFFGSVAIVLAIGLWTRRRWLRNSVALVLFAGASFCLNSYDTIARSVVGRQADLGRWTPEFKDGVETLMRALGPWRFVIWLAVAGLTVMVWRAERPNVRR